MIVFDDHVAETPEGKFVGVPIPVAPVVVYVIEGEIGEFIHKVGFEDAVLTVFTSVTVIVPVALTVPQPPVKGIE